MFGLTHPLTFFFYSDKIAYGDIMHCMKYTIIFQLFSYQLYTYVGLI